MGEVVSFYRRDPFIHWTDDEFHALCWFIKACGDEFPHMIRVELRRRADAIGRFPP